MRVGVGQSLSYLSAHRGIATGLLRRGTFRPDRLLASLVPLFSDARMKVAGVHLNTFNQIDATEIWRRQMLS